MAGRAVPRRRRCKVVNRQRRFVRERVDQCRLAHLAAKFRDAASHVNEPQRTLDGPTTARVFALSDDRALSNAPAPRASVTEATAAFCFPLLLSLAGAGTNADAARNSTTDAEPSARSDAAHAATLSRGARSEYCQFRGTNQGEKRTSFGEHVDNGLAGALDRRAPTW